MRQFITLGILVLLLGSTGAAAPVATLQTDSGQACPSGSSSHTITLTNDNDIDATYSIDVTPPWPGSATLSKQTVSVAAGETERAYLWVQAPADASPGTYTFTATVTNQETGESTRVSGETTVLSCRAVDVEIAQAQQTVCRAEDATYTVTVENTGQVEETYDLSAATGTLSTGTVTLAPGKQTTVTLTRSSTEVVDGEVSVTAESRSSYASDTARSKFTAQVCRSVELFVTPSSQAVCEEETATVTTTVRNTGIQTDTYTVATNTGTTETVTLAPNTSTSIDLAVEQAVGEHQVAVRATSNSYSAVTASRDADVTVNNCHDLALGITGTRTVHVDADNRTLLQVGLRNNGTQENTYTIDLSAPEWVDVKPATATIPAEGAKTAYVYVAPDFFSDQGEYNATIRVSDASGQVAKTVRADIIVGNETVTAAPRGGTGFTGRIAAQPVGTVSMALAVLVLLGLGYWYILPRMRRTAPAQQAQ